MSRPSPRQVFDAPQTAWSYLIQPADDEFEGQHFDRKEAGRPQSNVAISKSSLEAAKELVIKTVSAFANSNSEGGLLVLGISSSGEVIGIDHLSEDQRNSVTNLDTMLRNHSAEVTFHDCQNASGVDRTVCLIYSGYVPNALCETFGSNPKSWVRNGSQSVLMSQAVRDQVREFSKRILRRVVRSLLTTLTLRSLKSFVEYFILNRPLGSPMSDCFMRLVQSFVATKNYFSRFLALCFSPLIHSGFWHTLSFGL